MLNFLLVGLLWFLKPVFFLFFIGLGSRFFFFNKFRWAGTFLLVDSYVYVLLLLLSLFILSVVIIREKNLSLIILSEILIFVCILFFISSNFLIIYIFFELSMLPILVIILGFGSQIEKINSSFYLIFYASLCSFPFLFIYFNSRFFLSYSYYDFFLR